MLDGGAVKAACHSLTRTLPAGITGFQPVPYGYRRWNGSVWPDTQVDAYNRQLARIQSRHMAGYDTEALVNGLYNLANGFDRAGKRAVLS